MNNTRLHNNVETQPKDEEKETKANAREQTTMKKNDSKQAISSIKGPTTRSKNRQKMSTDENVKLHGNNQSSSASITKGKQPFC